MVHSANVLKHKNLVCKYFHADIDFADSLVPFVHDVPVWKDMQLTIFCQIICEGLFSCRPMNSSTVGEIKF